MSFWEGVLLEHSNGVVGLICYYSGRVTSVAKDTHHIPVPESVPQIWIGIAGMKFSGKGIPSR